MIRCRTEASPPFRMSPIRAMKKPRYHKSTGVFLFLKGGVPYSSEITPSAQGAVCSN